MRLRMMWVMGVVVCFGGGLFAGRPAHEPSAKERTALERFRGAVTGRIIWESNRDGHWRLYMMNADGRGAQPLLADGPDNDTQASFSPDGKRIVFARERKRVSSIWIANSDGSKARELFANGRMPRWRKGGRTIQFQRRKGRDSRHYETWEYDMQSGKEHRIFPLPGIRFKADIFAATGNDAATRFVGWSPRPRGTWVWSADGKVQVHVHPGCEGQISFDQRYGYGVHNPGDFVRFNLSDGKNMLPILRRADVRPDWNHTYFPFVSRRADWMVYGACPPNQHNHDTSDYEIFIVKLTNWKQDGVPVRLTFNEGTDRWPRIYVTPPGSPRPIAGEAYDMADNRRMNPPPDPLPIFLFASEKAGPEFGGDWGLWPQKDGCRGDTEFLAGADAEGGKGGALKIVYDIHAAPRSFSLWMTPGTKAVDLSAYDHFVLYAKGDVDSFTLVVKDASAGDPEAPDGIADCLVRGVGKTWKRFDIPFRDFRSRKAGAKVDWHTIHHLGIAAIAPRNPLSGTLWIDNVRAACAR